MYHLSIPQLTASFFFFPVSLCSIHSFERVGSPPEMRGWRQGFYNLASGAVSMGSCLLDYARDAPALNLISFNICLRGFKLTTQSYVIMASCTLGNTVPMQIKDTVHVWGILSWHPGFWNRWWIPKEGCERQMKPWHCLCDNGGSLDNPHSITRFSLSHSEHCCRRDFLVWIQEYQPSAAFSFHVKVHEPWTGDSFAV